MLEHFAPVVPPLLLPLASSGPFSVTYCEISVLSLSINQMQYLLIQLVW